MAKTQHKILSPLLIKTCLDKWLVIEGDCSRSSLGSWCNGWEEATPHQPCNPIYMYLTT